MNHPIRHIAVLIPARDEQELLPRCLASVLQAQATLPADVTCDVVVVADCCTDRTLKIARSMLLGFGIACSSSDGIVGKARARAAEIALTRYSGPLEQCWLANTDADCIVPEDWLTAQLDLARTGKHAVAGTVDVDNFSEHRIGVARLFYDTYIIHADGTHPHVHGANIGLRADVFVEAGGWASLSTAEDHDLWDRLTLAKCSKASVAKLKVITSGRRMGRAPQGFAGALAAHNKAVA
jgi:glycosyltransferase involved in cell wall biosynthesis